MIHLLLLLSLPAVAQNQQLPMTGLDAPQAQQVVQQALNQKFSLAGGTVTGNFIMGPNTSIQFPDGTVQTTAASGLLNVTSVSSGVTVSTGLAVGHPTSSNAVGEALAVYGLIVSSTPAPTITFDAGTVSVAPGSNNQYGHWTCGSGTSVVTITFSTPWRIAPLFCVCQTQNTSSGHVWYPGNVSTTGLTCNDAGINCSGEVAGYACFGAP